MGQLGQSMADAGITLLEYRNKTGSDTQILADAAVLRAAMPQPNIKLILDDRADLIEQAGFDGVHVDAGDVSASEARNLLGRNRIVGTFGGSETLVPGVLTRPVDYWSIGPVYQTTTKETSKPPIGPEGVRRLRLEAGPEAKLVGVGGITLETASLVFEAGATTVAVAGAIFRATDPAGEIRRWMKAIG